jgi:hypothetical protein
MILTHVDIMDTGQVCSRSTVEQILTSGYVARMSAVS